MALSRIQKALLLSTAVSSGMFAATAIPFAMTSSRPVEVQLQNETVFNAELKDISGPYLAITGTFSLAMGVSMLGMTGWSVAAGQSAKETAKVNRLERDLSTCQAALERIRFSNTQLQTQPQGTALAPQVAAAPVSASVSKLSNTAFAAAGNSDRSHIAQVQAESNQTPVDTAADAQLEVLMNQIQTLTAHVETLNAKQPYLAAA